MVKVRRTVSELTLNETLELLLSDTGVTRARFAAVVGQLYAQGSIAREDSPAQSRLYDEAIRMLGALHDYFAIAGFRLQHYPQRTYLRLYPPAIDDEQEGAEAARLLRQSLSVNFSAHALVLRHLYQKRLDVGDVEETGEAFISRQDIEQGLAELLEREPSSSKNMRQETYRALRAQRLVRLPEGFDEEPEDMVLAVRPHILDFITASQLEQARSWKDLSRADASGEPLGSADA